MGGGVRGWFFSHGAGLGGREGSSGGWETWGISRGDGVGRRGYLFAADVYVVTGCVCEADGDE